MWTNVAIGIVLAGLLAGCSGATPAATAHSVPVGSSHPAKSENLVSLQRCLAKQGAAVVVQDATRWRIRFADGYSMVFQVPKPGQSSLQTVLIDPGESRTETRDLQRLMACYGQAFG